MVRLGGFDTLGWVLLGQLTVSPAYAAGGEMPALVSVIPLAVLFLTGWALSTVAPKRLVLFVAAFWIAALAFMIVEYGVAGAWDRSVKFAVLMLVLTLPFAAGCVLGPVARKRFSGIGTRHG
ncbi:hypothetical protein [Bosea sp. 685]|uniref:hypothetical protein n=1 Tax=Bosea sp. 685 TaxID=3080057 RepID=UPI00289380DB|nr:hypothetical protein [Bosea sp. 685]WNJ90826.1 hypothetical protein RMR04_31475 [Bosea sp. 685]